MPVCGEGLLRVFGFCLVSMLSCHYFFLFLADTTRRIVENFWDHQHADAEQRARVLARYDPIHTMHTRNACITRVCVCVCVCVVREVCGVGCSGVGYGVNRRKD